ncbi:MAG: Mg chelatase, subunit ChlI [Alphaproteobacteria bacterium]|jgi:magnesium chelatase family protein|nr:Mg chelatase, subunit ChlI [Alphaproteobacteria bacterium]
MAARVGTVAFSGIDVMPIDVQVHMTSAANAFLVVGLPDKTVGESRERVRAALAALGIALPPRRIIVNLSPADVVKEGSHYDLPIALGLLAAMGVLESEALAGCVALGELALDGGLTRVAGVLPAALHAAQRKLTMICPEESGGEAAWAGDRSQGHKVIAAPNLLALVNHLRGLQRLPQPEPKLAEEITARLPDLIDVKGQEGARRALEVAAAGGHNLLMIGPPGAGKSMLAARLPGLLPPLSAQEALEISMIQSLSGGLPDGRLTRRRPFRDPHHSASLAALVGGGTRAKPGEVSLAHHGVLFLDELPEFSRAALEALRQPLETGRISVARVAAHVTYPARFQLVAAMNPCRCGYAGDPLKACLRGRDCAASYRAKLSGPLLDRIDLVIDVPPVRAADLALPPPAENSAAVAQRVAAARTRQQQRFAALTKDDAAAQPSCNAQADAALLDEIAAPDAEGRALLTRAAERLGLSARGWHRVLRVARTLADLDDSDGVCRLHIAEALAWRHQGANQLAAPQRLAAAG